MSKEIKVEESSDGSAVVELPESMQPADSGDEPEEVLEAEGGSVEESISEESDYDNPNDTDAVRQAKRDKRRARKEYHKQVQQEKDTRLQMLQRQNQELQERLSVVERKTHGSEIARINKAIEDQESKIIFAKQKIKEATETGNGDLLTSAQEMWFEARRDFESLQSVRNQAVAPRAQQTIQAPDPNVQRLAGQWMVNNPWYNANGGDEDSKVALTIDQSMAAEGWSPSNPEYWEELDNRLQKYLPHRYNSSNYGNSDLKSRKPRSVVTSTGRESFLGNPKNTFTLSQDQVRAMKDAGLWDDQEKRAKMIQRYAKEAKLSRTY